MKVTLSAAQLAAHAAGATLESLGFAAGSEVANPLPGGAPAATLIAPEIHAAVIGERDTFKAANATLTTDLAAANLKATTAEGLLATATTSLSTAQAAVLGLTTERDQLKADNASMLPVLRADVAQLQVALGGTAAGVETLDMKAALAKHVELSAAYTARFPGGRIAAPNKAEQTQASAQPMAYLDLIPSGPRAVKN